MFLDVGTNILYIKYLTPRFAYKLNTSYPIHFHFQPLDEF